MKQEAINVMKNFYNKHYNPFSDDIPVTYVPNKGGKFEADLYGEITSPSQFSSIISALGHMEEDDTFVINLQSYGGSVDAGDALLHAMKKCNGLIHAVATGGCHSMASVILLAADSFELSDGFSSLIHAGSMGYGGDFQEFKQHSEFLIKKTERETREIYEGFLTEEEILDVLEGKPIIVDAEGWMERHDKRNQFMQERFMKNVSETEGEYNPLVSSGVSGKQAEDFLVEISNKTKPKKAKPVKIPKEL